MVKEDNELSKCNECSYDLSGVRSSWRVEVLFTQQSAQFPYYSSLAALCNKTC